LVRGGRNKTLHTTVSLHGEVLDTPETPAASNNCFIYHSQIFWQFDNFNLSQNISCFHGFCKTLHHFNAFHLQKYISSSPYCMRKLTCLIMWNNLF